MSGFFLNYFSCEFNLKEILLNCLPYDNYNTKEKLIDLKNKYPNYFFYKIDNSIFYWPQYLNEYDIEIENSEQIIIKLDEKPKIFSKIIEVSIINFFKLKKFNVYKNKYSNSWIIKSGKDLLKSKINGLKVLRTVEFSTFYNNSHLYNIGFCLSSGIKNEFTWDKEQFKINGIDTSDLDGKDGIIFANKHSLKRFLDAIGKTDLYNFEISKFNINKENYKIIQSTFNWLNDNKNNISLFHNLSIKGINYHYLPNQSISYEILKAPTYFFYSEQTGNGYYNLRIEKLKPYSFENFSNKSIHIAVICPKEYEGTIENFISKLEDKIKRVFHISNIIFDFKFAENTDFESYKDLIYKFDLNITDLAIVIVNEKQKLLSINESPYYICKAKFIGHGIPTQEILINKIKNFNNLILDNICLNIYAKLGGTPWTIEKEDKKKEELIIGIGSTTNEQSKAILGIAQIFDYNGKYLIGECSPISDFDSYSENLELYLTNTFKDVLRIDDSKEKNYRLIFHLYKSASNKYEIKAIENTVKKFDNANFQYSLVHISYGHNFRLYNDDGNKQNDKGLYCKFDDLISILHFVPKSDLPLLIRIDKRSNFNDLYYISKQIFWFSHLSYRSYIPSKKTVTIFYPSLMARMTENLKFVDGWDYDILKKIGNKLWFI